MPTSLVADDAGAAVVASPTGAAAATERSGLSPAIAWYGVGMVAAVTIFGQLDRAIMPLLLSSIKRDTGLSDTELSLLMGLAFSAIYLGAGLPMARLSDRKRRTIILPAALTVWSLGTVLCGLAQSFWQFFLFRGIIGGGESVKGPASASLIPDLVPRERLARAFGIYNFAIQCGEGLALIIGGLLLGLFVSMAPVHVPLIGELHGWRMVYLVFGLPGIALALLFVLTVPEPARRGRRTTGSVPWRELARFATRGPESKVLLPIFAAAALNGIYLVGNGAWRPSFYERTYGLTPAEFGPISGSLWIVTAPIGITLGTLLVERMQRRWDDANMRLIVCVNLAAMPIAIAAPLMPTFELALACQFLSLTIMMMAAPVQLAAMQMITPNELRAQVNALYMITISVIGSGLGPTVIALMTDFLFGREGDLRYAMVTAAAIATPLVAFLHWRAMRPFGRLHRQILDAEQG